MNKVTINHLLFTIALLFLFTPFSCFSLTQSQAFQQAKSLQYEDPYRAISILEKNIHEDEKRTPQQKFRNNRFLFRLYNKTEQLPRSIELLKHLESDLKGNSKYKDWLTILSAITLFGTEHTKKGIQKIAEVDKANIALQTNEFKMWYFYTLSIADIRQYQYENVLININKVKQLAISLNDHYFQNKVLVTELNVHFFQQKFPEVIKLCHELLNKALSLKDKYLEAYVYSTLMNAHINYSGILEQQNSTVADSELDKQQKHHSEQSKLYLDKALSLSRSIGYKSIELRALIILQAPEYHENGYEGAIEIAKQTIELAKGENFDYERAVAYNNLSIGYRALGEYDLAIEALEEAKLLYLKVDNEQSLLWVLEDYSLIYEKSKEYPKALDYFKQYHEAVLTLRNKTNNDKVLDLQEKYNSEKSRIEIERLNQQNLLHQEKIKAERYKKNSFYLLAAILITACIIIWNRSRLISNHCAQLDELNDKLTEQAITDPLTKLYNRRFAEEVQKKWSKITVRRHENNSQSINKMGVLLADIDYFKKINDTYGHDVGDIVLKKISQKLLETTRKSDFVIRWGGEEFLLFLADMSQESLDSYCQKLLNKVNLTPIEVNGEVIPVTLSIGYTIFPYAGSKPNWLTWDETIKLIDNFLYMAKSRGRKRAVTLNTSNFSEKIKDEMLNHLSSPNFQLDDELVLGELEARTD